MNKNNDIKQIKLAISCLAKACELSNDPKIVLGLEPELNTLSSIIKKDLLRRINSEK